MLVRYLLQINPLIVKSLITVMYHISIFAGFLGCCGAWKESTWMLGTVIFTLLFAITTDKIYFYIWMYQSIIESIFILLFQFFVFLIIILVGEVAVGLLLYFDESSYKDVIKKSVDATVTKKYHNNTTATVQTFDLIQEGVRIQLQE